MRDPKRIPVILDKLREFWDKHPDLRLGQIICNAHNCSSEHKYDLFYLEDDLLMDGLDKLRIIF